MNSASAMKKKNAEKASTTPAAPNAPAPIPAFFADLLISALASSTSPRRRVEKSAIALCTSVPTVGSSFCGVTSADDTLWATGGSSFDGPAGSARLVSGIVPYGRRVRAPASPSSVLRGGRGQLVLDHVHDRGVGQRGDVAELAVLRDVAQQAAHDLARAGLRQLL